jgi:hypothetical protein
MYTVHSTIKNHIQQLFMEQRIAKFLKINKRVYIICIKGLNIIYRRWHL